MKKEVVFFEEARRKKGMAWPRANKVGNLIFVSGVAGFGEDGRVVGPGVEEQAECCFQEIKRTVDGLGSSMDNIVQMTTYMVNVDEFGKVRRVREKYIPLEKTPAATLVEVKGLLRTAMSEGKPVTITPPLLVEIECIAVVPDR